MKYSLRDTKRLFKYISKRHKLNGKVPRLVIKEFDRVNGMRVRAMAYCDNDRNEIVINPKFVKSQHQINETIIHEYGHYLVNKRYKLNDRFLIDCHGDDWALSYGRVFRTYMKMINDLYFKESIRVEREKLEIKLGIGKYGKCKKKVMKV